MSVLLSCNHQAGLQEPSCSTLASFTSDADTSNPCCCCFSKESADCPMMQIVAWSAGHALAHILAHERQSVPGKGPFSDILVGLSQRHCLPCNDIM